MPKVSIIMGIYNCAQYLEEAICSLLNQDYEDWELIMCDDASTDDTYLIAQTFAEKYPDKIKLLRNEQNQRLAATLNKCAAAATGEYLARMDGDDRSHKNRLTKEIAFLEEHREYALVGTYMMAFDGDEELYEIPIKSIPEKTDLPMMNPFHHATVVMRKEVFDDLQGYYVSKETTRAEDVDLWFRFFAKGYRGYNIQETLYYVREDREAKKRRKFKHALEASKVLYRGIRMLKLPFRYYPYILKPIVSQVTPFYVKKIFRRLASR